MGILIRGGRVVDAAAQIDKIADVYLDDGVIQKVGEKLEAKDKDDKIIDAKGLVVMPGLVDLHVHFRDPGQTEKEDIETGSHAAARGGVTTVVAMPNTTPVIDSPDRANYVKNKAAQVSAIHVLQAGAMTKGELGEELSDIAGMAAAGVPVLSEDGKSVMKASLCKQAMEEAVKAGLPIFDHCEDMSLRGNGCMNELHLCHCSTKGVAIMMKMLKAEGVENVTAEVCPHHFILTSDDIERDDPNYKMNPPLRTRKDVDALIEGLKEGYIQVISTDHAPHTQKDKTGSMRTAAFGIVGIETSFALSYTALVATGILTLSQLVEKMSYNPAQILNLPCGTLQKGHPADVIIADIKNPYTIHKADFVSKGKNTPFEGKEVKGKILYTICDGKIVYKDSAAK